MNLFTDVSAILGPLVWPLTAPFFAIFTLIACVFFRQQFKTWVVGVKGGRRLVRNRFIPEGGAAYIPEMTTTASSNSAGGENEGDEEDRTMRRENIRSDIEESISTGVYNRNNDTFGHLEQQDLIPMHAHARRFIGFTRICLGRNFMSQK